MSTDTYERRMAVRNRIEEVRSRIAGVDEAAADAAAASGLAMDDVDPDGHLRAALTALASVAGSRPGFDVLIAVPTATVALRLRDDDGRIDVELLFESGAAPDAAPRHAAPRDAAPPAPAQPAPAQPAPAQPAPAHPAPAQPAPAHPAATPEATTDRFGGHPPGRSPEATTAPATRPVNVASDLAALLRGASPDT